MYGIIKPEYSMHDDTNTDLLTEIASFDKIIIAGEANPTAYLKASAKSANIISTN